jgi:peroxiredoxin
MNPTDSSAAPLGTVPGAHARRAGDPVPDLRLRALLGTEWADISTAELCAGRNVIVFSLPGAFTPTCSTQHLPRYEELAPTFEKLGIDEIVCVSVNDPWVMEEWARNQSARRVRLLPDGNGAFTRAMGMLVDMSEDNLGPRSWRYAMLVRDGIIEKMFVEPAQEGDPYGVSDADTMLSYLDPKAAHPDEVAIISRPGCPFCAQAKTALEEAGLAYVDIALAPLERAKALRALTGAQTVPQVFVNGKLVGDSQALQQWLAQRKDGSRPGPKA